MGESRVKLLRKKLRKFGFPKATIMLDYVIEHMSAEKGFVRHDGSHYYYHPVDCALNVLNLGIKDEITVAAALGHDLFEDVKYATYHKIVHLFNDTTFGVRVANIRKKWTKDPTINYKGNIEELLKYLKTILEDWRCCVVKAVDRVHNISTLKDATPEKKMRQSNETRTAFFPFLKECRYKFVDVNDNGVTGEILETFFSDAKTRMLPHLQEIDEHYEEIKLLKEQHLQEVELLQEKVKALEAQLNIAN
jgi:hypothetical protein